jgi:glycosyltransferase involved in cell wall biosynthesis
VVIGEPRGAKAESIYRQLGQFPNVELKGRLPHADTINYIASAKALVSTSNFEGFPNIFLEAWASGVPVISLHVNPGDVINEFGLGNYFDGDYSKMAACINSNGTARIDPVKLREYISNYHDFERAADRFVQFLN